MQTYFDEDRRGRAVRKYETKMLGGHTAVANGNAYDRGYREGAYNSRSTRGNPYPAGVRHDNWDRGFDHGLKDKRMGRTASCWY